MDEKIPIVSVRGLTKTYGEGPRATHALRGVDLEIHPGEFVAILGPSGSGKSTFLHLIGLMDQWTSGELHLFGKNVKKLGEETRSRLRNRKIGFVFQFDSLLYEFTVLENVMMPALIAGYENAAVDSARIKARGLLERMGLNAMARKNPRELSGGEKQRVAIARALMNDPELVLADEPTGNLDRPNGERVFQDLTELTREKRASVLLVTHNEAISSYATRVLHLVDGALEQQIRNGVG